MIFALQGRMSDNRGLINYTSDLLISRLIVAEAIFHRIGLISKFTIMNKLIFNASKF
jgi:hypothetical protein